MQSAIEPADAAGDPFAAVRIDLYASAHKALRCFMADLLVALGRLDPDDRAALHQVLDRAASLLCLSRRHLAQEENFVHPAIEARLPGASARNADEHAEQLRTIAGLAAGIEILRAAPSTQRPRLAEQLYHRFALFVAEALRHMQAEESQLNAALWAHYSDAELLALHERIVLDFAIDELTLYTHWLAPALTPRELASYLGCLRGKLAGSDFISLGELARSRIDAAQWERTCALLRAASSEAAVLCCQRSTDREGVPS